MVATKEALNCKCWAHGQPKLEMTAEGKYYMRCRWCRLATATESSEAGALATWNTTMYDDPDENYRE